MSEIYQLPDNSGNNNGFGNIPFSIPIGGFGMGNGFGGGFGYGMNGVFDLFGLGIIGSMFNGGGFVSMPSMPKLEEKDFENVETENKAE